MNDTFKLGMRVLALGAVGTIDMFGMRKGRICVHVTCDVPGNGGWFPVENDYALTIL